MGGNFEISAAEEELKNGKAIREIIRTTNEE